MLQKIEPKIRRMEYRLAFAPLAALPDARNTEGSADQLPDKNNQEITGQEEVARLTALLQDMEQQFREREASFHRQLETETGAAFERGRAESEGDRTTAILKMAQSVDCALAEFVSAREGYLAQVEQEVVRLALSIAARILHRESQMDPLLLSGAVRVALGQLSDTTEVRLRIPAAQRQLWNEMIELMPNLPLRPQLIADDALEVGECALETHLGSVDLGVKAQLAEIEHGFFDLLEQRDLGRRDEFRREARLEEA